jgi:Flp pilus assembly protein TadD
VGEHGAVRKLDDTVGQTAAVEQSLALVGLEELRRPNARVATSLAVDLAIRGIIEEEEAVGTTDPIHVVELLHPQPKLTGEERPLVSGLGASPGAAVGQIALDSETAVEMTEAGQHVILVMSETTPGDLPGMMAATGILTANGGSASHAAVVARGMGRPAICGASALRIDPEDPLALTTLSYYQYLAQDNDGAAETYDKYIDLFPEDPSGYNNKALIYKRLGDYAQEEALYRVALALDPDDVTVLNNLGVCLAHQGRYQEALAVMRRLEALDPDDPYADLHRAKIHAEIGNDDLALSFLERALAGMAELDTLHHIEFRQDIRLDPSFAKLRGTSRFHAILVRYYGDAAPTEGGSP